MVKTTTKKHVYSFNAQEIKTIVKNGVVWFNASAVTKALGFKNSRQAIESHVDQDDVQKMDTIDAMGRHQKANFVNESGMYALVFGSKKQKALEFKRWVTAEVLPAIRKTGEYTKAPRLTRAKYNYPAGLLNQPHFMRPNGELNLNATTLVSDAFVSPLLGLLNQLRADGHQIEAAFNEAIALRQSLKASTQTLEQIATISIIAQSRSHSPC